MDNKSAEARLINVKQGMKVLADELLADSDLEVHSGTASFNALRQSGLSGVFFWRTKDSPQINDADLADLIGWKMREQENGTVFVNRNCEGCQLGTFTDFESLVTTKPGAIKLNLPPKSHQPGRVEEGHKRIVCEALHMKWQPLVQPEDDTDVRMRVDNWAGARPNTVRSLVEDALAWIAAQDGKTDSVPHDVNGELSKALAYGYVLDAHADTKCGEGDVHPRIAALKKPRRSLVVLYAGAEDEMLSFLRGLLLSHRYKKPETHIPQVHDAKGLDDLTKQAPASANAANDEGRKLSEWDVPVYLVHDSEDAIKVVEGIKEDVILLRTTQDKRHEFEAMTNAYEHNAFWSGFEVVIGNDGAYSEKFGSISGFFAGLTKEG